MTELQETVGRCLTCHWWFRFDESELIGDCVWHNGTKKTVVSKLRFRGILKTQADFGCVDWRRDTREPSDNPSRGDDD
jgi:hypothetical protein